MNTTALGSRRLFRNLLAAAVAMFVSAATTSLLYDDTAELVVPGRLAIVIVIVNVE
jgi:hypothetical protein